MKAAVCFFGVTRNFKKNTLDSIERCVFAPLSRLDPGFKKFAHFELMERISGVQTRTGELDVPIAPDDFKALNCDAIALTNEAEMDDRELNFDEIKKFGDTWNNSFSTLKNHLHQLYSLSRVTELLVQASQKFDLVIYSRADIRFMKPVSIPRPRPGTLYTPWFDKHGGLNDRFALGDFATMVKYGQRLPMAHRYCEETGNALHAETSLLWNARKQGLHLADLMSAEFRRVRANGTVVPEDLRFKTKFKYRLRKTLRRYKLLGQAK
jgi:hypothetical protein